MPDTKQRIPWWRLHRPWEEETQERLEDYTGIANLPWERLQPRQLQPFTPPGEPTSPTPPRLTGLPPLSQLHQPLPGLAQQRRPGIGPPPVAAIPREALAQPPTIERPGDFAKGFREALAQSRKRATSGDMSELPPPASNDEAVGRQLADLLYPIRTATQLAQEPAWLQAVTALGMISPLTGLGPTLAQAGAAARMVRPQAAQAVSKAAEAVKPILAGERGGLGKKPIKPLKAQPTVPRAAKAPWQMTRVDYLEAVDAGRVPPPAGILVAGKTRVGQLSDPHFVEVQRAIAGGKPVPPEVLADYPELVAKVKAPAEPAIVPEAVRPPPALPPAPRVAPSEADATLVAKATGELNKRLPMPSLQDDTFGAVTTRLEELDKRRKVIETEIINGVTYHKVPSIEDMPELQAIYDRLSLETRRADGILERMRDLKRRGVPIKQWGPIAAKPAVPGVAPEAAPVKGVQLLEAQLKDPQYLRARIVELEKRVASPKISPQKRIDTRIELTQMQGRLEAIEGVPAVPAPKPPEPIPPVGPKVAPEALEAQYAAYDAANREEYAQFLARVTKGMRPDQRAAYTKWFMEGRSEAEVAAIETRAGEILSGAKPGAAKPPVPEAVKPPPAGPPPGAPPPVGPPQPPSITPGPMAGNIIGLRAITPGLVRSEVVGNIARRTVSRVLGKIGVRPMVEAEKLATPAMRERARVQTAIGSQSALVGTKAEHLSRQAFTFDKQGRIPSLAGVNPDIPGAPTLADVAARLPTYEAKLTPAQLKALRDIEALVSPYKALLEEVGVEVRLRPDVMEGGFYLPRGRAALEGADEPLKVGAGLGKGVKKGFERPALFTSQAEGITKGYEYAPLSEALGGYAHDAGVRATDAHIVNYFKALTDETGRLVGETPKMRLMRQNPQIATEMETLKAQLDRLKRLRGALTERQQQVIDLWQHDPEFDDLGVLLEGLATMKAGKPPGMTRTELSNLFKETRASIQKLMPQYKAAQRRALLTPREQGAIGLPGLQGWTWPDEVANAANIVLSREGPTRGALAPAVNVLNAFNNLYRGLRATLDDSAIAIQGLLGIGAQPRAYRDALKVNIRAWGVGGDKVLGKFIADFDTLATQTGRMPSGEWAKAGLQVGGAVHEFTLGLGTKIATLPGIRQANRAFGFFGDALRLRWADNELAGLLAKGKSLAELKASGELERIATAANNMTGWAPGKAMASFGDLLLFAPRFLQARLETVTRAAMSLRPHATRDQVMARTALLRFISWGTMVTVAVNEALGNDTDFRWLVDGKRNPNFMRISFGGRKYSVFGTWDSLAGALTNVATGRPLNALRAMSSGTVAMSWDVLTGRDWNYRPVRETPGGLAKWFLGSFVPFAAEEIPALAGQVVRGVQEKKPVEAVGGAVALGGEVLGVKSYPLSPPRTLAETAENKKQKALATELKRLEVSSGRVTGEIAKKKLTPEERDRYQETTDTLMLTILPRMLSTRTYQKLSDDNKKWAIEMLMSASREEARGIMTGKLTEKGSQSRLKQEMNDTLEAAKERRPKKTPYWGK